MALGEREEVREHLEEADESEGLYLDEKRTQVFFFDCFYHKGILPCRQQSTDETPSHKLSNMRTYSSCSRVSRVTLRRSVVWYPWAKSTRCCRRSCLRCMGTSTKIEKSISCSPCSRSDKKKPAHSRLRKPYFLLTVCGLRIQSVLSAQFETTTDFGSLLRANTPVSRMMTTYTRRGPGQGYLKTVLAERINSLIEHKDLNLEINPLKVREDLSLILGALSC